MLKIIQLLPIIGIIFPKLNYKTKKKLISIPIGLIISILIFFIISFFYYTFNSSLGEYQYRYNIIILGNKIILGIDGLNLSLLLIVGIIMPILIFLNEKGQNNIISERNNIINSSLIYLVEKEIIRLMLVIEMILISVFLVLDIFYFFICFEILLIPMFLLIGKFGSKTNKIEAAYRFIIYTMIGSLLMLLTLIIIYYKLGSTSLELINYKISKLLLNNNFNENEIFLFKIL
jgi:NADH:ubiquinone oxidoreductase subunit 4 (subunit M)